MSTRIAIAAGLVWAAAAAQAVAAPTVRAGEWETRNGDGPPHLVCMAQDRSFDRATMSRMFAMEGVKCSPADMSTAGPLTHYNVACEIGGGHMTIHATIVATGPDSYTSRSQSHYEGGSIKMPDMDMSSTGRRLGPCRPGDHPSAF